MKKHFFSLEINGQDWDLYLKEDMKKMVGECRPDVQEIHIQTKGHKRKYINDSVLHELLHAIWAEYDIKHKGMSEEQVVTMVARALANVLEQIVPGVDIVEVLKK